MILDEGLRNIIAGADPDDPEDVLIRALLVVAIGKRRYPLWWVAPRTAPRLQYQSAARARRRRPSRLRQQ